MQTHSQPTERAHLLADDGELRTSLPYDVSAFSDTAFEQSKKSKRDQRRPFVTSPVFWLISIGYPLGFYATFLFLATITGSSEFLSVCLLAIIILGGLREISNCWRSDRYTALGFLFGLVGVAAIAIIAVTLYIVVLALSINIGY